MVRLENWPLLLSQYIRARKAMPFAWGSNDCVFFAIACVEALTGEPLTAPWKDTYSTRAHAEEILEQHGGIEALITHILGVQPHEWIMKAERGSVVLMELAGGLTAGVVDDSGMKIVSLTEAGTIRLPLRSAIKVWSY